MKLFELKNWSLHVSEEAWGLLPFKKILERDKTKSKSKAMKEMLFVFYFCDIKSNYLLMDEDIRAAEIKKDVDLPEKWAIDTTVQEAIDFYTKHSTSIIENLYKDTLESAKAIGAYLRNTKELLEERDVKGNPVYDIAKITASAQRIPKLMDDLNSAYDRVVKEKEATDRQKGSKKFNMFEDGIL